VIEVTRQNYRDDLETLRADVCEMGVSVREQLDQGLHALEQGDEELARTVIEGDDAINETYLELEQTCINLIALQQPVASDLRFISASFKVITDLERIGDLATNLGQYTLAAVEDGRFVSMIDVDRIGADASRMVRDAMSAYESDDVEACREIAARDDELDVLCQHASQQVARDLLETELAAVDQWTIEQRLDDVSRLLLTVRDLERVGDHAVNIAARTLYMVENDSTLLY
jgi:phosphate transport system protein